MNESLAKMFELSGIANGDRPIYDGTQEVRTFLQTYSRWASTYSWRGKTKSKHLVNCVSPDFRNQVYRIVYNCEEDEEDDLEPDDWKTVRQRFLAFFGASETASDTLRKEEDKLASSDMRMAAGEAIVAYRMRYMDQVAIINTLRAEVSGKAPRDPETLVTEKMKTLVSALGKAPAAGGAPQGLPSTPEKNKKAGVPASKKAARRAAATDFVERLTEIRNSPEYEALRVPWMEWKRTRRPPMEAREITRTFLSNLNRAHFKRANRKFSDADRIEDIVKYLAKEENLDKRAASIQENDNDAKADARIPTGYLNQMRGSRGSPAKTPNGPVKCFLCDKEGHFMRDCPSVCSACGENHPISACPQDYKSLSCTRCDGIGHVARVCWTSRHNKRSTPGSGGRNRRRRGHGHGRSTQICREFSRGSCSYGDRCRFVHVTPSQAPARAPGPAGHSHGNIHPARLQQMQAGQAPDPNQASGAAQVSLSEADVVRIASLAAQLIKDNQEQ